MQNKDRQILGFLAIALTAVFAIYLSVIPARQDYIADDSFLSDLANISPVAGDVVPGSVNGDSAQTEAQSSEDRAKGKAYPVMQVFETEQACKDATGRPCYFVRCADDAAAPAKGKAGASDGSNAQGLGNACAEHEETGWRPVVPSADRTAIPDVIAPPATLTTE